METSDVLSPSPADASVRAAVGADVQAVGAVHSRSWRTAYSDHLPAEVLRELEPELLAQGWSEAVTNPPTARHRVLVACAGPTVVGFAACDDLGDVVALHVDPAHQRRGHGSRLLSALVDHLRPAGATRLSTWCPVVDTARRSFFGSAGLEPDGAWRELEVPGAQAGLREARLVASLADP